MKSSVFLLLLSFQVAIQAPAENNEPSGDLSDKSSGTPKPHEGSANKITIVGTGGVGAAVAFSLLSQYVTDEIVLIAREESKIQYLVKDLQHGTGFIKGSKVYGGSDYSLTKNSKICIVTAGAKQKPGESRLDLLQSNLKIFKGIIPKLVEHSPDAILIIVTNPVDVMTYVTWKLVGSKNTMKIIGSGTNLDSSRLRVLISQDLEVSPNSIHGLVIGEHGDSSVTVWSGVNIAGVQIRNLHKVDPSLASKMTRDEEGNDWFTKTHKKVVNSAYEVIALKGSTTWAVGLSVANIAFSIIHDVPNVHAVSTLVKGMHGINDEIFMSLPCVLGENGVSHILNQALDRDELTKLRKSADTMRETIDSIKGEI